MSNLHGFDIAVIAAYFLVLAGIGYWAARGEKTVSADFFLASRDVGWFARAASLFASNIGSEHLVGLAGYPGRRSGLASGHFEWLACFMLLLLGWLFCAVLSAKRRVHDGPSSSSAASIRRPQLLHLGVDHRLRP